MRENVYAVRVRQTAQSAGDPSGFVETHLSIAANPDNAKRDVMAKVHRMGFPRATFIDVSTISAEADVPPGNWIKTGETRVNYEYPAVTLTDFQRGFIEGFDAPVHHDVLTAAAELLDHMQQYVAPAGKAEKALRDAVARALAARTGR